MVCVCSVDDDGDDDDFRRLRFFHTSAYIFRYFYFLFAEIEIEQNALHNGFTSFSGAKHIRNETMLVHSSVLWWRDGSQQMNNRNECGTFSLSVSRCFGVSLQLIYLNCLSAQKWISQCESEK